MWNNKNVLVAGGSGMVGRYLCDMLAGLGAFVRVVSLDSASSMKNVEFISKDLIFFEHCLDVCKDMDYVFNLLGVKGSPVLATSRASSFLVPQVMLSYNLMEAAFRKRVEKYLYTSSIGVYSPSPTFRENDVWKTFPSEFDRFGGWAKRIGELQAESYLIEYGWKGISIVRPSNVYGRFDNFDEETAMVVPSTIRKVLSCDDPISMWGDGEHVRDFIHAEDVARGMILAMEKSSPQPINLGSGVPCSIRDLVNNVMVQSGINKDVFWDTSKTIGDRVRLMDVSRAHEVLGFKCNISLSSGLLDTIKWYKENKSSDHYSVFKERINASSN